MEFNQKNTIERVELNPFNLLEDEERVRVPETQDEEVIPDEVDDDPIEDPIEESRHEEVEYDVRITGNPIEVIAKEWRSKGYLPDDFEIDSNITEDQLEEAYRKHKESLIVDEIRTSVLDEMRQKGYDEELLETARLLKYGVPQEQISQADAYQVLGTAQLDPEDEMFEGHARQILGQFYAEKGFSQEKIQKYIDRDLEDDDYESIVGDAQVYFRERAVQLRQYFKQVEQQRELEARQQAENTVKSINSFLDKGEIAGRKYTKEQMAQVKKALFDRTEVVVDAQGNRRRVTPYEKKRLEYQSNFELNLKSVVDFILGYDAKQVEEEGRLKGRSETLKELNRTVGVSIKGIREVKDKTDIQRREIA